MTDNKLMGVDEVAETIGVSRSYAYQVIRKLNKELQEPGHYVVPGKVNKAFLVEKFFGIPESKQARSRRIKCRYTKIQSSAPGSSNAPIATIRASEFARPSAGSRPADKLKNGNGSSLR